MKRGFKSVLDMKYPNPHQHNRLIFDWLKPKTDGAPLI